MILAIYRPHSEAGKEMFSQVCVILYTGGLPLDGGGLSGRSAWGRGLYLKGAALRVCLEDPVWSRVCMERYTDMWSTGGMHSS